MDRKIRQGKTIILFLMILCGLFLSSTETKAAAVQTKTYKNLAPDTEYLFLVVRSVSVRDILSESNLLYVGQKRTDGTGSVDFSYEIEEKQEDVIELITGMEGIPLETDDVSTAELTVNGKMQKVRITVTHEGEILEEGKDYTLAGTLQAQKSGTYYFTVVGTGNYSGIVSGSFQLVKDAKSAKKLKQPTVRKISNAKNAVNIKWSKVSSADGYEIYRKNAAKGKWKKTAVVKKANIISWSDKNVKNGTEYTYRIRAYKGNTKSAYSKAITSCYLKPAAIQRVKKISKGTFRIEWQKNKKASGYQIQYAASKSFKNATTINVNGKSNTVKQIKGLKGGKAYYIRVRAYRRIGGEKYYSTWSSKNSRL